MRAGRPGVTPAGRRQGISPKHFIGFIALYLSIGMVYTPPGNAQTASLGGMADKPPNVVAEQDRDIVVNGHRIPEGPFPIKVYTAPRLSGQVAISRGALADAEMFARCAKTPNHKLLRDAVDGPANQYSTEWALDRIIRANQACYMAFGSPLLPPPPSPYFGDCNPRLAPGGAICRAFYDRGALVEKVLDTYAPDLHFTTAQLLSPDIHARFRSREDARSVSRAKGDKLYFGVAACIVALNPDYALQYRQTSLSTNEEKALRNYLLGTATRCLNGAKKVSIDPVQFRIYIVDAIYSWAVAVRGTDSLISSQNK